MIKLALNSINTQSGARDEHLKTKDFLHVDSIPFAQFEAANIDSVNNGGSEYTYVAHGNLTIRGITKPCDVKFNYSGSTKSDYGDTYSFEGTTVFNRVDFKIGKEAKELSSEVRINFNVDAKKPKK